MRERRAKWLWHVMQTGGDDVTQVDLEEHLGPNALAAFSTAARLQEFAASGPLRGADLVSERDDGDACVHEARTASGLRLEHRTAFDEEGKVLRGWIKVLDGYRRN